MHFLTTVFLFYSFSFHVYFPVEYSNVDDDKGRLQKGCNQYDLQNFFLQKWMYNEIYFEEDDGRKTKE